jgi:hypothetical protein
MTVVIQEQLLWLVPAGMAICFMFWVLWNLLKEERRRDHANDRVIRAEFILHNTRYADHERLAQFRR